MTSSYDCHPERVELDCPACGSDRVLPLAFPRVAEELVVEMPERALGKCGDCGHRLTAVEIATQEYHSPD
jgi:ssDNA-binding Zn-finger/Zn-ribbon topoisomerase 1